jgi:hypothetical protein
MITVHGETFHTICQARDERGLTALKLIPSCIECGYTSNLAQKQDSLGYFHICLRCEGASKT